MRCVALLALAASAGAVRMGASLSAPTTPARAAVHMSQLAFKVAHGYS